MGFARGNKFAEGNTYTRERIEREWAERRAWYRKFFPTSCMRCGRVGLSRLSSGELQEHRWLDGDGTTCAGETFTPRSADQ